MFFLIGQRFIMDMLYIMQYTHPFIDIQGLISDLNIALQ
jgi:hypothetical protein